MEPTDPNPFGFQESNVQAGSNRLLVESGSAEIQTQRNKIQARKRFVSCFPLFVPPDSFLFFLPVQYGTGVTDPSTTLLSAPVAPVTFPGKPCSISLAKTAKATASLAAEENPKSSWVNTR